MELDSRRGRSGILFQRKSPKYTHAVERRIYKRGLSNHVEAFKHMTGLKNDPFLYGKLTMRARLTFLSGARGLPAEHIVSTQRKVAKSKSLFVGIL